MSSLPSRFNLRILVLTSEAMWITLCLSAIANTWPHFSMNIPYWALLIPSLLALAAGSAAKSLGISWKPCLALAVIAGFVILMVGAGLLASSSSVSFVHVAFMPWTIKTVHASSITSLSWFFVSLVVARAIQVALTEDRFARVIRSVVVASIAYFALFLTIATQHSVRLTHATHFVEPIFLVYFLAAIIMLRMSRASDIERPVDANQAPATGTTWKIMLALPLVVVGVIAFFLADLLGSSGAGLRHVLLDIGNAIAWVFIKIWHGFAFVIVHIALGIVAVISFFVNLFVHHHHEGVTHFVHKAATKAPVTKGSHAPLGLTAVLMVLFLLAILIGLRFLIKNHVAPPKISGTTSGDEKSSTFSWRNLFSQIKSALRLFVAWLMRPLHRSHKVKVAQRVTIPEEIGALRRDYLRLLMAARSAGLGRERYETPLEFAHRLSSTVTNNRFREALDDVTHSYETVRYREQSGNENFIDPEAMDLVLAELVIQETVLHQAEQGVSLEAAGQLSATS